MLNRLVTGDCLSVMGAMEAGSVDLIVTSPPYPGQKADTRSPEEWMAWFGDVAAQMRRVLRPTGVLALNVMFKRLPSGFFDVRIFTAVPQILESVGFNVIDIYIYGKPNPTPNGPLKYCDIPAWEPTFVCTPSPSPYGFPFYPQRRPYSSKSVRKNGTLYTSRAGDKQPHPDGARQTNVMMLSSSGDQNRPKARGQSFPQSLPERFILQHTGIGDVVLDPFAGAGTTCKVAQRFGRQWIGIELAADEAQMAREWLAE